MDTTSQEREVLEAEIAGLHREVGNALRFQLVLAIGLGVFVWRSAVMQHRALVQSRTSIEVVNQDLRRQLAIIEELQKFAVGRPQFAEILKRHGIEPAAPLQGPAPAR